MNRTNQRAEFGKEGLVMKRTNQRAAFDKKEHLARRGL